MPGSTIRLRLRRALSLVLAAAFAAVTGAAALAYLAPTRGQLHRVWLDGHQLDLNAGPSNDTLPVVSPDGTRVAFVSDRGERAQPPTNIVHLYLVGSDGHGLQRVSSALSDEQSLGGQVAWSPDGKRLVVAASARAANRIGLLASLSLITPGKPQRVIARAPIILSPEWSPGGRVIAFNTGDSRNNEVWAVTPAGKRIWRVKGRTLNDVWSATGQLAVLGRGSINVYDRRGRLRMSFIGRSFAWSQDGKRLASLVSNRVEVRSLSGRRLFQKRIPGLHTFYLGIFWVDGGHVVVPVGDELAQRSVSIDIANGRISNVSSRYWALRSPDSSHIAETVKAGRGVLLRVSRLDGSGAHTLVRRPNCPDLIESDVQWLPDGSSLVVDFRCQGR